MNNKCLYFIISLILLCPANLFAFSKDSPTYISRDKSVGLIQSVYLTIDDEVVDGCWTNVEAVRNRLRYRLEAENITVYMGNDIPDSERNPMLTFSLVGFRSHKMCIVSYDMDLQTISQSEYGQRENDNRVVIFSFGSLWSESGVFIDTNADRKIMRLADSLADQLLADILSARRDLDVIEARKRLYDEN